ncbi:RNA polymerase III transcription factor IIIC subunit-domain-containing protein [Fomitopsis serialis]|uniref:RNA polymerase III transcription factor IIIC subunit-domain-containing protein n=1 Tax=Fomitopsis serialis TaxID=139415 RepID=UPI002007A8D8|nr:RNA polymerase III transcription factor IIIC subunit-domain-containing protein [Neoantrodia serialis]KAH9918126.1 RNA polymerase III transcription factor IIIC subunit-domain-containing protein [Neoantrodia serialis]
MNPPGPIAGPSALQADPLGDAAPERDLPSAHFYSVEYPGYVKPTSVSLAVERLGGQLRVENAFKRASSKTESLLELSLRPGNPFAHPVPGDVVSTSNILLKVVKRKRKRGAATDGTVGEYTVEALGMIPKTARFRSMVDYQYKPDMEDPIAKLRSAMDTMDVDGILRYRVPEEREDYIVSEDPAAMDIDPKLTGTGASAGPKMKSNLRLFTPPLFSRQAIPQNYNYKSNSASVVTTVVDEETGEEKKRLINRMRWKGYGPISISFSDTGVPDKPSAPVEEQRANADRKILKRLQELFQERAIWTRAAIFNQFMPFEVREIINSKVLLPLVSYVFQDGPWRDTQIRLGYDPRQDKQARIYQRLYFRNTNHPIVRPSVVSKRQEGRTELAQNRTEASSQDDKRTHIFDGVTVTKETAAFQLCDITDPMLKEMIEDEEDVRDECNERDGWYSTEAFERIKTVLRHKFFSLLGGHVATREECEALLVPQEGTNKLPPRPTQRLRFGKHNMAKGALPPEDAAVRPGGRNAHVCCLTLTAILQAHRLMATLQQKTKDGRFYEHT